jgi:outer membrane lipoprotein carrier protein
MNIQTRVSAFILALSLLSTVCSTTQAAVRPESSASPTPAPSVSDVPTPKAAAKTRKSKPLPALLEAIEAKYAKSDSLSAEFSQVNTVAATAQKKTSSGTILVRRPDKVRWETLKPDKNLLVSDGKTFWFYTPPFDEGENGQVIERKSSEAQSKLAQALLSGRFSVTKDMKIRQINPSTFALVPKKGSAGTVSEAQIVIDSEKMLIQKVILSHRGGNRSEISLSNIALGAPADEAQFHFTPPAGTEKIQE